MDNNKLVKSSVNVKLEPIVNSTTNQVFMQEILFSSPIPNHILFSTLNINLDLFAFSQALNFYIKHKKYDDILYSINCFYDTYFLHNHYINKILRVYNNLYIELIETSQFKSNCYCYNYENKRKILIDDFGKGFNNIDKLKIGAFAVKLDRVYLEYPTSFLKETVEIIKSYGSIPIFEKIETKSELDKVKQCGGEIIQGFLLKENYKNLFINSINIEPTIN